MRRVLFRALRACLVCSPLLAAALAAQGDPRGGTPGGPPSMPDSRESTWPAPTAEDWKKPCLIPFQRSWEDALAVARETQRPILVCVNMDGEIASEHYAGVRYRDPEKARLFEPYVCVIASVFRHTPRDYDDQGRRILCPRFGSVTCGEHIALEPLVYERFMDGRRIAPRHIGVDMQGGGSKLYDVFYRFDTASVFADIEQGAAGLPPLVRGELPLEERVASRDGLDRAAVERAYLEGDRVTRRRLLQGAFVHRDLDQIDLLRLALFGLDVDLARIARAALAESDSEKAIDLIVEALRVPMEQAEREKLVAALERLAQQFPRARTLAAVQGGLARSSEVLDVGSWSAKLAGAATPVPSEWSAIEAHLEGEQHASASQPADPAAQLALAEAALELAVDPETARILSADYRTAPAYSRLQFEDARRAARAAERLGASGWRLQAVLAIASYFLGDLEDSYASAERAVRELPAGDTSWNGMASLALFAQARQRAIQAAVRANKEWPPQWLADVNATYGVLGQHPFGADHQVAAHHDFLKSLGARGPAAQVLGAGLRRFPESWLLHERLRIQSLEERGVEGLEAAYAPLLGAEPRTPSIEWFAGYASLVTAEFYRRAGDPAAAEAAYGRAIEHYERGIRANPASRDSADHYVAVALAGRGRLAFERGDDAKALGELEASFARKPEAAAAPDGLNLSAVDTAKGLLARLRSASDPTLAPRLEAALARLDPAALELPAYEREVGAPASGRDQRPR